MSADGPPQGANYAPSGGSAAAHAASVGGRKSLLVKGRRDGRDIVRVTPQTAGWA
jgi:hypothetical protein